MELQTCRQTKNILQLIIVIYFTCDSECIQACVTRYTSLGIEKCGFELGPVVCQLSV